MRSFLLFLPVLLLACASAGSDNNPGEPGTQGGAGSSSDAGAGGSSAGNGGAAPGGTAGTSTAGSAGATAGISQAGGAAGGDPAGQGGVAGVSGSGGASGDGGVGGTGAGQGGTAAGSGGSGGSDPFGGGGSGGGPEAKCETAPQYTVGPEQPLKVNGDTALFANYFGAYCDKVGASGKDTVIKVDPKASGTVIVHLAADKSDYDPVLSVTSSECTVFVTNKDGSCANYSSSGGAEELEVQVSQGVPFWVYIDGVKGFDGAYSRSVEYAGTGGSGGAAAGGSGGSGQGGSSAGSGGEAGAGGSGDSGQAGQAGQAGQGGTGGAPAVEGQSCAEAVQVQVGKKAPLVVTGSTAQAANNFLGYCNAFNDARDQVYEVTALDAGQLVAKLEPLENNLDVALYAHKDECSSVLLGSETNNGMGDCSELLGPGVTETLDPLPVVVGTKTYVFVDTNGKNGVKGGPFRLTLTLQ